MQEAITSIREAGSKAYVAFLDVRKAFDTVWHDALLVKLYHKVTFGISSACGILRVPVVWFGRENVPRPSS